MRRVLLLAIALFCVISAQVNCLVPLKGKELNEIKKLYRKEISGIRYVFRGEVGDFVYYSLRDKDGVALALLNENKELMHRFYSNENYTIIQDVAAGDVNFYLLKDKHGDVKAIVDENKQLFMVPFYCNWPVEKIEKITTSDTTCYYLLEHEGRCVSILDKNKAIVKNFGSYGKKVVYIPAREGGYGCDSITLSQAYWYPIQATEAVFHIDGLGLYKSDFTPIMLEAEKTNLTLYPNDKCPFYLKKIEWIGDGRYKSAMYTLDGKEIIPLEEQAIIDVFDYGHTDALLRFFKVGRNKNGVTYDGAYPMTEADKEEFGIVPAEYYNLYYSGYTDSNKKFHKTLMVQKSEFENAIPYTKDNGYKAIDRDMGEYYYKAEEYEKAIEYYAEYQEIKPWAAFYSAESFYKLAKDIQNNIHNLHRWIFKEEGQLRTSIILDYLQKPLDIDLMVQFYGKAHDLMEYYMGSGDYEFLSGGTCPSCVSQESADYINKENPGYKETEKESQEIAEWLQKQIAEQQARAEAERARAEAARAEMERRRQQQAAFWGAVINTFTNSLSNIVSRGSASSYNTGASRTETTSSSYSSQASSSNTSSSSTSASSSSGKSGDAVGKAQAEGRVRVLKHEINECEKKLKEAEAFETKCRADHSNFLRQAIEDVNMYKKKLQGLQEEMNSLKSKYGI